MDACLRCKKPIRHDDRNVLREVTGFTRPRDQGGANHIIARHETGRLVCGECAILEQAGLLGQEALL
jgi:hypothetical protein